MGMTEKAPVKREDLFEFQFLSEAALSPDGRYAAYVVTQADREKNGYNSAIWMYDLETGKNRLMAERGGAKGIVWLDEKSFLFASDRGDAPDQESAVYYRLSVDGGEAESFLTLPHKAEKLVPMGEDQFLFTARVEEYEKEEPGEYEAERGKDYEIYEELPFWFNGKGIVSRKRTRGSSAESARPCLSTTVRRERRRESLRNIRMWSPLICLRRKRRRRGAVRCMKISARRPRECTSMILLLEKLLPSPLTRSLRRIMSSIWERSRCSLRGQPTREWGKTRDFIW